MKIKLIIFFSFLLMTGLFSGCSEKIIEWNFYSDETLGERQKSIDSSLKVGEDGLKSISSEQSLVSIRGLLSQNKDLKCSWRVEKEEVIEEAEIDNLDEEITGGVEEGNIYFSAGRFFKEMKIQENTRENIVKILNDKENIYQWSTIGVQGTKMTIDNARENELVDFDKKYDWNCADWIVDEAIFKIPTEIKFIEIQNTNIPVSDIL